jgi:hypothetical protein
MDTATYDSMWPNSERSRSRRMAVTRYATIVWEVAAELIQLASTEYLHKRLSILTVRSRIAKLEREVDDAIDRARRERRRAA